MKVSPTSFSQGFLGHVQPGQDCLSLGQGPGAAYRVRCWWVSCDFMGLLDFTKGSRGGTSFALMRRVKSFGVSNRVWTLSAWVFLALAGVNQVWAEGQDGVCTTCQAQVSAGVPKVTLPELALYPSAEEVRAASIQVPAPLQYQPGFEPWGGSGFDPFRGRGFSAELRVDLPGVNGPLPEVARAAQEPVFPLF